MAPPSLPDLPSEIRLLIWDYLGIQKATYHVQICVFGICNTSADMLSILQVNRQIREDILKVLSIEKLQVNVPLDMPSTPAWRLPDFVKARQTEIRTVLVAASEDEGVPNDTLITYWPPANILDRVRELLFKLPKLECLQIDQDFRVEDIPAWQDTLEGDQWTVRTALEPNFQYSFRTFERRATAISVRLGLPLYGFDRFSYTIRINDKSKMKKLRTRITFENRGRAAEKASASN